jgi:hypothetical protein
MRGCWSAVLVSSATLWRDLYMPRKDNVKCERCGRQIVADCLDQHLVYCNDDFMVDDCEADGRISLEDISGAGYVTCHSLPTSTAIDPFVHRDHGQYGSFQIFDDFDEDPEP